MLPGRQETDDDSLSCLGYHSCPEHQTKGPRGRIVQLYTARRKDIVFNFFYFLKMVAKWLYKENVPGQRLNSWIRQRNDTKLSLSGSMYVSADGRSEERGEKGDAGEGVSKSTCH